MRKFSILLLVFCVSAINVVAQQLSVKSVDVRIGDLTARSNTRIGPNGKECAVIKVAIVGVKDMVFPDAVGNVKQSISEYVVFVPDGLKVLKYKTKSGKISGSINFSKYNIEIESKGAYGVVFNSPNNMRAAIFVIQPQNAKLIFDGNTERLDGEGMAAFERKVGEYRYKVEAPGYESQNGVVRLTNDDISTTTNIILEPKQYPFVINSNVPNANLFIDNVPYGPLNQNADLEISEGFHQIRLTAEGYENYEQTISIAGYAAPMSITMLKAKVVVPPTSINIRPSFYVGAGGEYYDKNKYRAHEWGWNLGFSAMQHFAGIFAIKEGIAGGLMYMNKKVRDEYYTNLKDSTDSSLFFEVPLQLGFSFPIGNFNKNLISILAGGYGKVYFLDLNDSQQSSSSNNKKKDEEKKTNWDYGFRGTIMVDISSFSIGAEVSHSLNDCGTYFGIKLAFKLSKKEWTNTLSDMLK